MTTTLSSSARVSTATGATTELASALADPARFSVRAIDRLRARAARPSAPLEEANAAADPSPDALASAVRSDEGRRLAACLDELRPEQAGAIRTAFLEGVAYETLAHRLGRPPGTVKSWIRRGLASLAECLGE